jgi:8-amino-7-oxononanoate synthase
MNDFESDLQARLEKIRAEGLYRELRQVDSAQGVRIRVAGQELLNFSSNDYLGLANHSAVREAAAEATRNSGAGSGASRLICGSLAPHHELETTLATFKGTDAALVFSSGYATALGTITALLDKDDVLIIDKLVHASIVDAARLSGATLRVFAHNDVDDLAKILKWTDTKGTGRLLIVTESLFSMDGDLAPLREIIDLKERYGAWLMLDEAHATGLFGQHRRGLAEAYELSDRVEMQMGTLGKSLGSAGGYIAGSRLLVDLLINKARSFIFSTAPPPAVSAAATAAVRLVQSQEGETLRSLLWARVDQLKNGLVGTRWTPGLVCSPIIPLRVGDEAAAMKLAADLRARGIFIPAVRYPTVARGEARLRLTLSAAHSSEDIAHLLDTLSQLKI